MRNSHSFRQITGTYHPCHETENGGVVLQVDPIKNGGITLEYTVGSNLDVENFGKTRPSEHGVQLAMSR